MAGARAVRIHHLRLKLVKGEGNARAAVNAGQWGFENGSSN
jgi:hypothetical protein